MEDRSQRQKRLVYSPKAYVFIHSRKIAKMNKEERETNLADFGGSSASSIIDVTNDVVGGVVNRLINQPSSAVIKLNNKNYKYTGKFNPVFLPMDGITIWLERVAGKPIQVFTGYIDEIPSYQMYPGVVEIRASCTLKRLMYTYFDPGTQALSDWFFKHGWVFDYQKGLGYNPDTIGNPLGSLAGTPDSGFADILYSFMTDICNWDKRAVIISQLPEQVPDSLARVFQKKLQHGEQAYKDSVALFRKLLALHPGDAGGAAGNDANSANDPNSGGPGVVADSATLKKIREEAKKLSGPNIPSVYEVFLASLVMTKIDQNWDKSSSDPQTDIGAGVGMFAFPSGSFYTPPESTPTPSAGYGRQPITYPQLERPAPGLEASPNRYKNIRTAISTFSQIYSDTIKTQGWQFKSREEKVALALSLGMNKEHFYAEIFSACADSKNKDIAEKLTKYGSSENIDRAGPDVLMATEVYSDTVDSKITWEQLMGTGAANIQSTFYDGPPETLNVEQMYEVVAEASDQTQRNSPVYDPFLKQKIKMDLKELKYYVTEFGRDAQEIAEGTSRKDYSMGGLEIGTLVQIINQKNGKSVVAMVADKKKNPNYSSRAKSSIGLSAGVINEIGLKFDGGSKQVLRQPIKLVDGQTFVLIKRLNKPTSSVFEGKIKEGNPTGLQTLKPNTLLNFIGTAVGPGASGTGQAGSTFNQNDIDIYNSSYKDRAPDVLSEYFFVANSMGLRLALRGGSINENMLVVTSNNKAKSNSLVKFAEWAKTQVGVNTCYYKNDNVSKTLKGQTSFIPESIENYVVIIIDNNAPRPIYDGSMVHIPKEQLDNTNDTGGGATQTGADVTFMDLARIGMAASFTTMFSFPADAVEAALLTGDRALMNDIPVLQGVQQLTSGCMRHFMSLPNGQFIAFYPDEFGKYGRKPYWVINDIEIEDFSITYNDNELITHMYVNGAVNNPLNGISLIDKITSLGVFTIQDAYDSEIIGNNERFLPQRGANEVLQIYGPRKEVIDDPIIRSPYFEFFYAYNRFLYHWSKFHSANARITFQPEIMTGGIVAFPDHNINMYVQQVTHSWDYSSGFRTDVLFTCPSTIISGKKNPEEVPFG